MGAATDFVRFLEGAPLRKGGRVYPQGDLTMDINKTLSDYKAVTNRGRQTLEVAAIVDPLPSL